MMISIAVVAVLIALATPRASKWTIYQAAAIDGAIKNVTDFDSTLRLQDLEVEEIDDDIKKYEHTVSLLDRRSGKIHRVRTFTSRGVLEAFQKRNPSYGLPPVEGDVFAD
jgi:hypothetical protein